MANFIYGQIVEITETRTIPSKVEGRNPIITREFAVQTLRFNQFTGTPIVDTYNTPQFKVYGNYCQKLDGFNVGDYVKVTFALDGFKFLTDEGKVAYTTRARALGVESAKVNIQQEKTVESKQPEPIAEAMKKFAGGTQGNLPF